MPLFDENISTKLSTSLSTMKDTIKILFFTQKVECPSCNDIKSFLIEFSDLSGKIELIEYNFPLNQDKAKIYNITKTPAIVLLDNDNNDSRIRFYGMPTGYQINSFLEAIQEVSGNIEEIPISILKRIQSIKKKINIQVLVTLICPYCPSTVINANKMALANPNITASMVETSTFPHIINKYNIQGVPKIIINEKYELVGVNPIENIIDLIENI